jgi:hypothetical protein
MTKKTKTTTRKTTRRSTKKVVSRAAKSAAQPKGSLSQDRRTIGLLAITVVLVCINVFSSNPLNTYSNTANNSNFVQQNNQHQRAGSNYNTPNAKSNYNTPNAGQNKYTPNPRQAGYSHADHASNQLGNSGYATSSKRSKSVHTAASANFNRHTQSHINHVRSTYKNTYSQWKFHNATINNRAFDLATTKGKVVLLCPWNSDSEYALRDVISIERLATKYQNNPQVQVFAVSNKSYKAAQLSRHVSTPVVQVELDDLYELSANPFGRVYVLDQNNVMTNTFVRNKSQAALKREIAQLT